MRHLWLLFFSLVLVSNSCKKEENEVVVKKTIAEQKQDLVNTHTELLISLEALKSISIDTLQSFAHSSDFLEDLQTYAPIAGLTIKPKYLRFEQAITQSLDLSISKEEIVNLIRENTKSYYPDHGNSGQGFTFLPCYDAWEYTVKGAFAGFVLCVAGSSGTATALCSIGLGITMFIADDQFESCLAEY